MSHRRSQARFSLLRSIPPERRRSDGHARLWLAEFNGGEVTAELNERWQFGDGEVGVFRAHGALEHLSDPIHTMREIHRCLAPQGWLLSQTSSTDGRGAFQAPTHVSFWNSNSFWCYTRADQNRFIDCPVRFQANRVKNFFPSDWHREHQIVYVMADLPKVAGRAPGGVAISGVFHIEGARAGIQDLLILADRHTSRVIRNVGDQNGAIVFHLTGSVNRDLVNNSYQFSLRTINEKEMMFVDFLGHVGRAVKIK